MAHCDQTESGNAAEQPPMGPVTALWHDTTVPGSGPGLGCSSNGSEIACSFQNNLFNWTSLKVYSSTGAQIWSSFLLGPVAFTSVPMISPSGAVIAADGSKLVSFTPSGQVAWETQTPGGIPISPSITDNGAIVLATLGGPVSAYDAATGKLLSTLSLSATVDYNGSAVNGYYDTINSPAVYGNRIYIAAQFRNSANDQVLPFGRLYAIDFNRNPDGSGSLAVAWTWDFEAPSGGSPTVIVNRGIPTIYFDGSGATPGASTTSPQLFALEDLGSAPALLWSHPLSGEPQAAATPDPRGGVWTYSYYSPYLIRLDQNTGAVLQTIDVAALLPPPGFPLPRSAMTITGSAQDPVMIIGASPLLTQASYVLAIDLPTGRPLWYYRVDQGRGLGGVIYGQFPVVMRPNGLPEVVFGSNSNGVWAVGAP